jgi:hypothetical protein
MGARDAVLVQFQFDYSPGSHATAKAQKKIEAA